MVQLLHNLKFKEEKKIGKKKKLEFLVGNARGFEDVSVYLIVGLEGMRKTMLAQIVFDVKRVTIHFEVRIWMCF